MTAVRLALRTLRRTPTVTLASIATLALAVGVNTAMFSVVYGVLMRPLPFGDPDALVQLTAVNETDKRVANFALPEFADWEAHARRFAALAVVGVNEFSLTNAGDAEALRGAVVSDRFFDLLQVVPGAGRLLTSTDTRAPVVVLSDRLWRRRFAGRADVPGGHVTLNGQPYTVVGIARADMRFPDDVDLWTPVRFAESLAPPQWKMRGYRAFTLIGRMNPAVTLPQAQDDAGATARWLAQTYPRFNDHMTATVEPLRSRLTGRVRPALLLLLGSAALVLLIACANLASLALVRGASRVREMAIHAALGASPTRLVGQSLVEAALVSLAGSGAGLLLARWILDLLPRFAPADLPRLYEVRLDQAALVFAVVATVLVIALCGGIPALVASRAQPADALRDARTASPPSTRRLHRLLVASEIAMSVVLLVGASLLSRSLAALVASDLGVREHRVLTLQINLDSTLGRSAAQQAALVDRLLDAMGRVVGVRSVAATSSLPPNVAQMHTTVSTPARDSAGQQQAAVQIVAASPDLFTTLGVPLLGGRPPSALDTTESRRVLILSATAARRLFPDREAVGQTLAFGPPDPRFGDPEVVGVVGDLRYSGLDAPPDGAVYMPHTQRPFRVMYLVARTSGEPSAVTASLRRAIADTDPTLAASNVRTLDDLVADASAQPRFRTWLLVALAAIALALAAIGLYGVVAHAVVQRTVEIGVRTALGATSRDILFMVGRDALELVVAGLALGLAGALAFRQTLATFLYGIAPTDPLSFVGAALVVALIALAATIAPARRAARVDPLVALRAQ